MTYQAVFEPRADKVRQLLDQGTVDILVVDPSLVTKSGKQILDQVAEGVYGFIPMIVVPELAKVAADSCELKQVLQRVETVVQRTGSQRTASERNSYLEELVAQRTEELAASRLELVVQLSRAAELRDRETGNHVLRVGMFSYLIASAMGQPKENCEEIFLAATLHDVGKIAVPDAVLRKRGVLQQKERAVIESHCRIGHRILSNSDSSIKDFLPEGFKWGEQPKIMKLAAQIARSHHERWDGKGYPDKLKGDQIPIAARIVAVADVLDALRSKRSYKAEYDWKIAAEKIIEGRGTQFDPDVTDAFIRFQSELQKFDKRARNNEGDLLGIAA